VEITDKTDPPVARIIEYGKFIYEQEKKEREANKKQKDVNIIKGVRLSMRTSGNDLQFKAQTVDKFLKKGYKVRVEFVMRGREKALRDMADRRIKEFLEVLTEPHTMDQPPTKYPRGLSFVLSKTK
jgi:translation initiation factor IF-3